MLMGRFYRITSDSYRDNPLLYNSRRPFSYYSKGVDRSSYFQIQNELSIIGSNYLELLLYDFSDY